MVKRALWGEATLDLQLSELLSEARMSLTLICSTWPDVFMPEVRDVLDVVMDGIR